MAPKTLASKIESCTLQLHSWKPFDSSTNPKSKKKPCRSDRSTNPNPASDLDLSKLSLIDSPRSNHSCRRQWLRRKRRRGTASRSISGRSSDTHCRASVAHATCSDFHLMAGGTDSSGEFFINGEGGSWASDASESCNGGNRESLVFGSGGYIGNCGGDVMMLMGGGNDVSGYGSEQGYRGDGELGEEDGEEEEDESGDKFVFWNDNRLGRRGADRMEVVRESNFSEQKTHHRCRRKMGRRRRMRVVTSLCFGMIIDWVEEVLIEWKL